MTLAAISGRRQWLGWLSAGEPHLQTLVGHLAGNALLVFATDDD